MVVILDPRIIPIFALIMFLLFIVTLIYTLVAYISASRGEKRARASLARLGHMEKLARLRHRDLDAFAKELNILRAKKGKKGIPKKVLEKVRYNLMYSIDEI